MKQFRLKVGIDVDDIVFSCNEFAVKLANENFHLDPPVEITELDRWDYHGERLDNVRVFYNDPILFKEQPVIPGAKEFIKKLQKKAEVYFVTAVSPEFMGIRAKRLMEEFPNVPKENIIMTSRKDMVDVDVLLDDGAHNIASSKAAYPVLMRKPWNKDMTGCLSVKDFDGFLSFIDMVLENYQEMEETKGNHFFILVGPSASGKSSIMEFPSVRSLAERPVSYTTRAPRKGEKDGRDYHFLSVEKFEEKRRNDFFYEASRYADASYGSSKDAVLDIFKYQKKHAVMAMDIAGAIKAKKVFGERAVLVYVDRPEKDLLLALLKRKCSNEEKVARILSLKDEERNAGLCDEVIQNNDSIEDAAAQLVRIMRRYE